MATASPKQWQAIRHGFTDDFLFVALGAVRSGKTVPTILGHCGYLLNAPGMDRVDHGVIGVTEGTLRRNVLYPELNYLSALRLLGAQPYVASGGGLHIVVPRPERDMRIWLLGAADSTVAVDRIAGATWGTFSMDEGPRIPEEVWDIALSRLSLDASKIWTTGNAAGAMHWFRKRFIVGAAEAKARVVTYYQRDNPGISKAVQDRIAGSLRGHMRKRLIDVEWCDAAGLIFPHWLEGSVGDTAWGDAEVGRWSIGISWSEAGVFGAVAAVHPLGGQRDRAVVVSERTHNPQEDDRLSYQDQAKATSEWIQATTGGADPNEVLVVGNEATPLAFVNRLRRDGYRMVEADDDRDRGIQQTSMLLGGGDWRISRPGTPALRDELESWVWDAAWAKQGREDRPADAVVPLCHALRHIAYAPPSVGMIRGVVRF